MNKTEMAKTVTDKIDVGSALKDSFSVFMDHPFICLGVITMLFLAGIVFFKKTNDDAETWMQNKTHKIFWTGLGMLFSLGFSFAVHAGLLTMDVLLRK